MITDPAQPMLDVAFLEQGAAAAKAVARLEVEVVNAVPGVGTAFLIARDLVLAAYHTLFDVSSEVHRKVQRAKVLFDYAAAFDGTPLASVERTGEITTIEGDVTAQWAVMRLNRAAPKQFPVLSLTPSIPLAAGGAAHIIQHPAGMPKKVVIGNGNIKSVDDNDLLYSTNTMPGSSGAPVFNERWEVVGMHYSAVPSVRLNRAVRIEHVLRGLRSKGFELGVVAASSADEIPHIYISASPQDSKVVEKLETYLAPLKRAGKLSVWHRGKVPGGADFAAMAARHLRAANVILLLMSAHYLSSDDSMAEATAALELASTQKAVVIPVLARPSMWEDTHFVKLQHLPRDGQPLMRASGEDEAFVDVAKAIGATLVDGAF